MQAMAQNRGVSAPGLDHVMAGQKSAAELDGDVDDKMQKWTSFK
jgi:hypothetical protein